MQVRAVLMSYVLTAAFFQGGEKFAIAQPGQTGEGETYILRNETDSGDAARIEVHLEVGGELKVRGKQKIDILPMSVVADLVYDEKLLAPGDELGQGRRAIRHYHKADATIKVGRGGEKPTLRDERRTIVAQTADGTAMLFCPTGPLSRSELDLLHVVGNSLLLDALLPAEAVATGGAWIPPKEAIQAMLGLDALALCEVEATLVEIRDDIARIDLAGTVHGAAEGVSTEIDLKARLIYHRKLGRVAAAELAVKEKKSIGHVAPGIDVVAKLTIAVKPIDDSEPLADERIERLELATTPEGLLLAEERPKSGVSFAADRRWYITEDSPKLIVLRMVDRGELVAQCNLSPLPQIARDKLDSMQKYQNDVKHTLGDRFGRVLAAGEWTDEAGQRIYRVVVEGEVEKLPIEWRYYLITDRQGRRVAAAFTVESGLAPRLGDGDRELISTLRLMEPQGPVEAAAQRPADYKGTSSK